MLSFIMLSYVFDEKRLNRVVWIFICAHFRHLAQLNPSNFINEIVPT